AHTVAERAFGLCQHMARTDDRLQLLNEPRFVRPRVVALCLDNDLDACHRSRSLFSKSSLTLERIRRIGGGRAIGCVYVIRAAFTTLPTTPLPAMPPVLCWRAGAQTRLSRFRFASGTQETVSLYLASLVRLILRHKSK